MEVENVSNVSQDQGPNLQATRSIILSKQPGQLRGLFAWDRGEIVTRRCGPILCPLNAPLLSSPLAQSKS